MIYLVVGPDRNHVCGYATAKQEAQDVARELNSMLDGLEDQYVQVDKGDHYGVLAVKMVSEHLANCKALGFPF